MTYRLLIALFILLINGTLLRQGARIRAAYTSACQWTYAWLVVLKLVRP